MVNLVPLLTQELSLQSWQIEQALSLLQEGATVPFIARYRKERTGEMDEIQLRHLQDRHQYLQELEDRKQTVLKAIADQGKLTPALKATITHCLQKTELEDLYLPYKPKRRTRATIAREQGLEPLAQWLDRCNSGEILGAKSLTAADLEQEGANYVNPDQGVATVAEALQGAADILAEGVAERAELRAMVREMVLRSGRFHSQIKADFPEGSTKFELYRSYDIALAKIAPHNLLALLRGEREGVLDVQLLFDEEAVLLQLTAQVIRSSNPALHQVYQPLIRDAFQRLMKTSITKGIINEKKAWADGESIQTFEANLRELLLAAPAGMKPTLAIDPGFRTGCKVAVIDPTGQFLHYQAIFPHQSKQERHQAAETLKRLVQQHQIQLIAIGNGTASRETEAFVGEALQGMDSAPITVMVNEAGASIYSASEVAIAEFPDLDITVRGAISIGRRLQDPLAELVKLDPKSIGVGQYQHDVDQKQLKQKLEETVESCVNYVGVDLNTASKELLTYVSGLSGTVAGNIIAYRNEKGAFRDRKELLKVPKLGPKAFEQCAGFLRIRHGKNPLDNTAVHPESYGIVAQILQDLGVNLQQPEALKQLSLGQVQLRRYVTETVGEPTLRDILEELDKPGRDPRAQFTYAQFRDDIQTLADLQVGMELEGVVTNVANFGAFVDIGVHQDGLVHISQLADRFVSDPQQVVKVGQVVKVRVQEVNPALKRIGLSMKAVGQDQSTAPHPQATQKATAAGDRPRPARPQKTPSSPPKAQDSQPSIKDLKARFNRKA
ncbi:Tex family protein [Prochlorothrix hollandica]|uniref:Tex family protein n=1 Tax=Prochlorothrix hollandica TaxID=1223 RepID=UPI00334102DB